MIKNKMLRAKPNQTLHGHLADCLKIWELNRANRSDIWEHVTARLGFNPQICSSLLSFIIYAHDFGKATARWQHYLDTGQKRITHALFSALMCRDILGPEICQKAEGRAALLAVLAHHGMLYSGAFTGEAINGLGEQSVTVEEINKLIQDYDLEGDFALQYLTKGCFIGKDGARMVSSLHRYVEDLEPEEKLRFKGLYTLFLSVLQLCDNEASYHCSQACIQKNNELLGSLVNSNTDLRYITKPRDAFMAFQKSTAGSFPNNLQKAVKESASPFLIVQAGCGSGKTAAALHYAASLAEKGLIDRIIITLPTRFTTNSMFWDFNCHYGLSPQYTGIYHGEIESVLLNWEDSGLEQDRYVKDLKFENSFFNRTINVCTVDHLLYSFLHCYKYADRAFGNLLTSAIVFDEIHFYDTFTLRKIGQCMEFLRQLRIPHMIMSATIPQSLVGYLKREAEWDEVDYHIIRQGEIGKHKEVEAKPFRIVKMPSPMIGSKEVVSQELLSLLEDNLPLRQMVVVNQVERAKILTRTLLQRFPGINVICYHSEFSRQDRDEKEKLIRALFKPAAQREIQERELISQKGFDNNEQVILISTQICELSLDISSDVMYSEIAPVDAVAQRGGRLHRKGVFGQVDGCNCIQCKRMPGRYQYLMYLFPIEWEDLKNHLPYKDIRDGTPLLKLSWDLIGEVYSFSGVTEWVDKLYSEVPPLDDEEMREMILEDAVFGRRPGDRFGKEYGDLSAGSFRVRHSEYSTITVVPELYVPEEIFEPLQLVKKYGVRVSLSKLLRNKESWFIKEVYKDEDKYIINILNLPYTWEVGFSF